MLVRKEKIPNYLDVSAFAIVFLRAEHAGATVLREQLWTHDILFAIDFWLMNHETLNVHLLVLLLQIDDVSVLAVTTYTQTQQGCDKTYKT